jgi:hypothetical protein
MQSIFDENGFLRLDEIVYDMPSYKKIMEDRVITEEEIIEQSNIVLQLMKKIDQQLGDEDKKLFIEAISEMAVLYTLNSNRI